MSKEKTYAEKMTAPSAEMRKEGSYAPGARTPVSPETNKQATEARGGTTGECSLTEMLEHGRGTRKTRRLEHHVERIALSILCNPKVEQLLGRNPCDPGRAGDYPNAGAALAHSAVRLAKDYLQALDEMTDEQFVLGRDLAKVPDEKADPNRPA